MMFLGDQLQEDRLNRIREKRVLWSHEFLFVLTIRIVKWNCDDLGIISPLSDSFVRSSSSQFGFLVSKEASCFDGTSSIHFFRSGV